MDLTAVIVLILFIIGAALAFKLIKSAVKALFSVLFIGIIIIAVAGFFVYKDVTDLKENLGNSNKLLLLDVNNEIAAGVKTFADGREAGFIKNKEELPNYPIAKSEAYYKIIAIKLESLINDIKATEMEADGHNVSKTEAEIILRSENAKEEAIGIVREKEGAENGDSARKDWENKTDTEIKGMVFGALFKQLTEEKGPGFGVYLLKEHKKGNVKIIPETAVFKSIGFVPNFLIDKLKILEGG